MKKILKFLIEEWKKSFYLEKRNFYRKKFTQKVVFVIFSRKFPDKKSSQHEAISYDISEEGLSMLVDHLRYDNLHIWKDDSFMEPNYLKVAFKLGNDDEPIEAEAEVVNFSLAESGSAKRYKVGLKFLKMSKKDSDRIKAFLSKP